MFFKDLIWGFIFQYIGATTLWILNGFKGTIDSYMTGPYENSNKSILTSIVGGVSTIIIAICIFYVVEFYNSTRPETIPGLTPEQVEMVKEMQNEDGTFSISPEVIENIKEEDLRKTFKQSESNSDSTSNLDTNQ